MNTDDQRGAIRDAIEALPLKAGADLSFAEMTIGNWLRDARHWPPPRSPMTPRRAADALDALAVAVRDLKLAAAAIVGPAFEAINTAKFRRGLEWPPASSTIWSFMNRQDFADAFDATWPQLVDCAKEAAAALRAAPGDRPGGPRNESLIEFAGLLAFHYHLLTGRPPGRGKGDDNCFGNFVSAVFQAGELGDGAHYADKGVREWELEISRQK